MDVKNDCVSYGMTFRFRALGGSVFQEIRVEQQSFCGLMGCVIYKITRHEIDSHKLLFVDTNDSCFIHHQMCRYQVEAHQK